MGRNPKDPFATRTCRVALAVNAKISRGKTSAAVHNLIMLHPVKVRHLETGVHGRLAWRRSWESQGQSYAINFDGRCPLRVWIGRKHVQKHSHPILEAADEMKNLVER